MKLTQVVVMHATPDATLSNNENLVLLLLLALCQMVFEGKAWR